MTEVIDAVDWNDPRIVDLAYKVAELRNCTPEQAVYDAIKEMYDQMCGVTSLDIK